MELLKVYIWRSKWFPFSFGNNLYIYEVVVISTYITYLEASGEVKSG